MFCSLFAHFPRSALLLPGWLVGGGPGPTLCLFRVVRCFAGGCFALCSRPPGCNLFARKLREIKEKSEKFDK
eukprot:5266542-Alexandrium_andersonii.AAC.1